MVKKIIVKKIMSDEAIKKREGEYFDESHYHTILNEDTDVYNNEGLLILKLRKNCLAQNICKDAVDSLRDAAKKKHENRGASAGPLNRDKMANYIGEFVKPGKFRTRFKSSVSGILSKQATSNLSPSNIIGFFDKPDRNLKGKGAPCRLTAFNRDHPELWNKTVPFLKANDKMFKKLVPNRYAIQKKRCQETPDFAIADTAFSTVTINYSWRTALHTDKGDLVDGFGNIIVLEDHVNPNHYEGCYTGFPQYGVAANVRQGDFMSMNVHEWHCNTEFKPVFNKAGGKWKEKDKINDWHFNRLSVVCYLREKMIRCKNMDTNRLQLLNKSTNTNPIFSIIKKYKRPDNSSEFLNQSIILRNNLENYIENIGKINQKNKSSIIASLNTLVQIYFSYTGYYINDFKKVPIEYIHTFNDEIYLYISLNNQKEDIYMEQDTINILEKIVDLL
jgi:hypothetical protein